MGVLEAEVYEAIERVNDSWIYDETAESIYFLRDACNAFIKGHELKQLEK